MGDLTDSAPSIERLAELQQFVANFAGVLRVPQLADTGRPENDVEHSFSLAFTCWFLAPKIAPKLKLENIFKYALAHDTVEIHAGDTFLFGNEDKLATKSDREDAALDQLAKDWPDFTDLVDSARGYKNKIDEEAKFVYSVDKLLPVFMVDLGEAGAFWRRHKITLEMAKNKKKDTVTASTIVAPYYDKLVIWMTQKDYFYKDGKAS